MVVVNRLENDENEYEIAIPRDISYIPLRRYLSNAILPLYATWLNATV